MATDGAIPRWPSAAGSPSRLHTSVAPTRPAASQCVHTSSRLASTVGSAPVSVGATRSAMRTLSGFVAQCMPSHVATPSGVLRRTQPRPSRCSTSAPVPSVRWTADDSYSRVRSKQTSRSRAPTVRTTNDERPSARRRTTLSGDVPDVDERQRPDGVRRRDARREQRRRSAARRPRGRGGGGRSRARRAASRRGPSSAGSQIPSSSSSRRRRSTRRPWASRSVIRPACRNGTPDRARGRSPQVDPAAGDEAGGVGAQPGDDLGRPRPASPRGGARSSRARPAGPRR